jgi:hypothetical protein
MFDMEPPISTFIEYFPPRKLEDFTITPNNEITLTTPKRLCCFSFSLGDRHPEECTSSTRAYLPTLIQYFYDYALNFERLGLGAGHTADVNWEYLHWVCRLMAGVHAECRYGGCDLAHVKRALRFVGMLCLKARLEEKRMIRVKEIEYPLSDGSNEKILVVNVSSGIIGVCTANQVCCCLLVSWMKLILYVEPGNGWTRD